MATSTMSGLTVSAKRPCHDTWRSNAKCAVGLCLTRRLRPTPEGDSDAAHEQLVTLLTHRAWASLLRNNVHPASRPELPDQLRSVGEQSLANSLEQALRERAKRANEDIGAVSVDARAV
jgi:hypothetical protein